MHISIKQSFIVAKRRRWNNEQISAYMLFRLSNAQLSEQRSAFVLFKVYWDLIQFAFKVPPSAGREERVQSKGKKADAGICCSAVFIAVQGTVC